MKKLLSMVVFESSGESEEVDNHNDSSISLVTEVPVIYHPHPLPVPSVDPWDHIIGCSLREGPGEGTTPALSCVLGRAARQALTLTHFPPAFSASPCPPCISH